MGTLTNVARRQQLIDKGYALRPEDVREKKRFYVVAVGAHEVILLRAGQFMEDANTLGDDNPRVIVRFDCEESIRGMAAADLGLLHDDSVSLLCLNSMEPLGREFTDGRAEHKKIRCPCGTLRVDATRCSDWPDCMIP